MISNQEITCPVCGHQYISNDQACSSCPLHQGCDLTCCPLCGHTTIDPNRSKLATFASKIIERWNRTPPQEKSIRRGDN